MKKEKIILSVYYFFAFAFLIYILRKRREAYVARAESERVNAINRVMFNWIENKVNPAYLQEYLLKRRLKKIAIYGTASLGEQLYYYLKDTDIEIAYLMDQGAGEFGTSFEGVPIFRTERASDAPPVDAVIVTPVYYYDDIKTELEERKIQAKKILSLEKIVCV